jgi:hypothetical protein
MAEQGGDGFQPHAAVDRLGGQGVPQPVRVHAGNPGRAADPVHDPADDMPVQQAAMVGDQPLVGSDVVEVGSGPGGEQAHQFGVQGDVAVVAELAQRDAQPVPGADPHHRVGVETGQLTGPHPGPGEQLDHEPVAGSALARAAAISRAASRSPGNFGSGSGFLGMFQAITGLRAGAPGRSHSMIRSKNWRTVRIRCRRVSAVIARPPPGAGRPAIPCSPRCHRGGCHQPRPGRPRSPSTGPAGAARSPPLRRS